MEAITSDYNPIVVSNMNERRGAQAPLGVACSVQSSKVQQHRIRRWLLDGKPVDEVVAPQIEPLASDGLPFGDSDWRNLVHSDPSIQPPIVWGVPTRLIPDSKAPPYHLEIEGVMG